MNAYRDVISWENITKVVLPFMRQNNDTPQIEHAEGVVRNNYAVTVSSYLLITCTFHINMLFTCETFFIICNMAF